MAEDKLIKFYISNDALISAAKLHRQFLKKISENPELKKPAVIRNAIRRYVY